MAFRVELERKSGGWIKDQGRFTRLLDATLHAERLYREGDYECYDVMCASCDRSASDCARYPRPECSR